MSDYKNGLNGVQYCQPSAYADNVKETNQKMGYHNLADKANRSKEFTGMHGAKMKKQEMGGKFGY